MVPPWAGFTPIQTLGFAVALTASVAGQRRPGAPHQAAQEPRLAGDAATPATENVPNESASSCTHEPLARWLIRYEGLDEEVHLTAPQRPKGLPLLTAPPDRHAPALQVRRRRAG